MQEFEKISIIVPIYNVEAYLSKCIDSILKQTYKNLQILLIDDGSTDTSGRICDDYAKQDERIEVLHTLNKGPVAARKLGLSCSTGDYVGFVDSDDFIEPNMYEVLLKNLHESGADFVHTGYIEENNEHSKEILGFQNAVYDLKSLEDRVDFLVQYVLRAEKERCMSYSMWSKLYKRELICESYFCLQDDQLYGEDLCSLCLCILQSKRISMSKCALYHYIVRNQSLSHLQNAEFEVKEIDLCARLINTIQKYDISTYFKLKEHLSFFIKNKLMNMIDVVTEKTFALPRFYYKDVYSLRGKKIIIYGAGVVGQNYYAQFCKYKDIEIIAWCDTNWQKYQFDYMTVEGINKISNYIFDLIIIAVKNENMAEEIKKMLLLHGQHEEQILWTKPQSLLE